MSRVLLLLLTVTSLYAQQPNINFQKTTEQETSQPYKPLLLVTVLSGFLAYDAIQEASFLEKERDKVTEAFNQTEPTPGMERPDTDNLNSRITRERFLAAAYVGVALVSAFVAFKNVEVKASHNSLSLQYRF